MKALVRKVLFNIKQWLKMVLQYGILPVIYTIFRFWPIKKNKVIFADAHTDGLPYSMQYMYDVLEKEGKYIRMHCVDFRKASFLKMALEMFSFMKDYARAEVVFICDYYLPAASCKRRKGTQVVQLWHACGAFKKFGYDAREDISGMYKGSPMKNVSLATVSSDACVPIYASALHLPKDVVKATGVSRTDAYFDKNYRKACRDKFFALYPEARGRKILLWAPTFRGNAGSPKLEGLETVEQLQQKLGSQWYVIIKLHPHLEQKLKRSNCTMATEDLLAVADVLMTDYSSVMFDFMIMKKPVVLFAPDNSAYLKQRGFYLDYSSIPAVHVRDASELPYAVKSALTEAIDTKDFCRQYMGSCDGYATQRILKEVYQEV